MMPIHSCTHQTRREFIKASLLSACIAATTIPAKADIITDDEIKAVLYEDGQLDIYADDYEPLDSQPIKEWSIPRDQGPNAGKSPFYSHGDLIKSVTVHPGVKPITMRYWFADCINLVTIDFSGINTSECVDMQGLFSGCRELVGTKTIRSKASVYLELIRSYMEALDITREKAEIVLQNERGWSTIGYNNLTEEDCSTYVLDLSFFDTSLCRNMSYMFHGCGPRYSSWLRNIEPVLNISSFDASSCINMSHMFDECGYTTLEYGSFNTSSCQDLSFAFHRSGMKRTPLNSFLDTSSCINMSGMFDHYTLSQSDISSLNTSSCTDMSYLFTNCILPTVLDLTTFDTSSCRSMQGMFMYDDSFATPSGESFLFALNTCFDTSSCEDMSLMFYGCSNLSQLDTESFTTSPSTDLTMMFADCSSLRELNLSGFSEESLTLYLDSMFIGTSERLDITWPPDWQQVKEDVGF